MLKFYICRTCGNLVLKVEDGGTTPSCCGRPMSYLSPASTDGAIEKHVPAIIYKDVNTNGKTVLITVGTSPHPSESHHYIEFIAIETNLGIYIHHLSAGDDPCATFLLANNENIINAYAYCNLHGMWIN